jgi:glycosyltransferase involved in cell wall biosynthesis
VRCAHAFEVRRYADEFCVPLPAITADGRTATIAERTGSIMKVHYVVPSLTEIGGPAYTIPVLARGLTRAGVDLTVHTHSAPFEASGPPVRVHRESGLLRFLGSSVGLHRALHDVAADGEAIIHSHGMWRLHSLYAGEAVRGTRSRHVVTPDGTLYPSALRHRKWRKSLFWRLGQARVLEEAACIHVVTEQERQHVRALGLLVPIAIVPWGVTPRPARRTPADFAPRKVLCIARMHPLKGLDVLLRAWHRLGASTGGWQLQLVGPDSSGFESRLRELAGSLQVQNVAFVGYVSAEQREELYRRASLFVLPSHGESWSVAITDAFAHGLPAIVTPQTPWRRVQARGCGWCVEPKVGALAEALDDALGLSDAERAEMGDRARRWMREFEWPRITEMMADTYRWLLGHAPRPDHVPSD